MPVSHFANVHIQGFHPFYNDITDIQSANLTISAQTDGIQVPEGSVANRIVTIQIKYTIPRRGKN